MNASGTKLCALKQELPLMHPDNYLLHVLPDVLSLLDLKLCKIELKPEKHDKITELALIWKRTTEILELCSKNTSLRTDGEAQVKC